MAAVILENITMRYGAKTILSHFNLTVEKGEFLCLMGESGAGKSTLLNIIGLLEKPTAGTVSIMGEKALLPGSLAANSLRREKIGFLFQNYGLIDNEDIDYNLDIVREKQLSRDEFNRRKKDILHDLGLGSTTTNTKVYKLSGGEQQRVALARLILKNPELILCDEPTGSLDMVNAEMVIDLLMKMNQSGKTVILVTHDPRIAEKASRVISLNRNNN